MARLKVAFGPANALVVTHDFINVAFDEACIHWRCSLAVERRTRNAKVPSSTLGSAFFSNFARLLPAILLFSAVSVLLCPNPWLDSFVSRPPIPSRVDLSQLCTPHAQHALVRLSQTSETERSLSV